MRHSLVTRLTAGAFIVWLLAGCQVRNVPPTPAPSPKPAVSATPTPLPEPITQWARFARASSEWSDTDSSARQAAGPQTIPGCGDSGDAWASYSNKTREWLEVYFKEAVEPQELRVHLNFNPKGVRAVDLIDVDGQRHEVFSGGFAPKGCPDVLQISVANPDYVAVGARIWIDQTEIRDWVEVDAVQLVGVPAGPTLSAMPALPTPTFAPAAPLDQHSYADRPDDHPELYQFHVIYALFNDQNDRERDLDGSIGRSIGLANAWFDAQSGGSTLRFDSYQGELDVTFVRFDQTAAEVRELHQATYEADRKDYPNVVIEDYYLDWIDAEIHRRNLDAPGKYYIVYLEAAHPHACGYSQLANHMGVFFLQTQNCGYGRLGVDAYAWENEFVLLHEVLHGLGFTSACAPHSIPDNPTHVDDSPKDLMYPYVGRGERAVLDVGNDDYFNHSRRGCPDLADSALLEPLPEKRVAPAWPSAWQLP